MSALLGTARSASVRSAAARARFQPLNSRHASTFPAKLANSSLVRSQAYIDGQWISSPSSKTFEVLNPATGQSIASMPDLGVKETRDAINAASKAWKSWKTTTPRYRHDLMMKLFRLMSDNAEDLGKIITAENGKPVAEATGEIKYGSSFIEWFAEETVRDYGDVIASPFPGTRNLAIKQPIGVVGIITPWNFPNAMITRKLGAALAAGCTTVIKAPEDTPLSALAIAHLAEEAGIPPGVINVLTTKSSMADMGKELCENPTVRKVSFTGSTNVGKLLMQQSSSTLKKLSFELGGNAPFIVFEDADIEKAVQGAIASKFRGSGQTCVCANRLFVHESIYADFASELARKVSQFKIGNGFNEGVTHGPVIHERGLKKVEEHVKDAVEKGASIVTGGRRASGEGLDEGYFWEPTVLVDVPKGVRIDSEETFGPVAPLYSFSSESEVLSIANDTDVGLAGYFYSRDIGRAFRVAEALEVGMVGVNTGVISEAAVPFGGVKHSGFGREGSKYGLQEYQAVKFMSMAGLEF